MGARRHSALCCLRMLFLSAIAAALLSFTSLIPLLDVPISSQPIGIVKCSAKGPSGLKASVARATFGRKGWKMAVHGTGRDEVSKGLLEKGSWNLRTSRRVLAALKALGPRAVLIDVGAHIGWYTLLAAHRRHNVVAFESSLDNCALLRSSLCSAPQSVRNRVRLLPYGLVSRELHGATCELWHHPTDSNGGDAHNVCAAESAEAKRVAYATVRRLRTSGFQREGRIRVRALDELVRAGVVNIPRGTPVVLKIDVKGWEPLALSGATEFLTSIKPKVILAEFAPELIWRAALATGASSRKARSSSADFLRFMERVGYNYTLGQGDSQEVVFVRSHT